MLPVGEQELHLVVTRRDLLDRALLAHVDAAPARERDERGVEVAPRRPPPRAAPCRSGSGSVTRRPAGETSTVSRTSAGAGRDELGAGQPERLEQRAARRW